MTTSKQNAGDEQDSVAILEGADVSKLTSDVFMRFQAIKLAGDGCSSNYRFLIYNDGRFFMQENRADDCAGRPDNTRFNRPIPSEPARVLDAAQLEAVRDALIENGFEKLPASISPGGKVFDGAMQIMEVHTGTGIKRVISMQSASKAIEAILEVIWAQVY